LWGATSRAVRRNSRPRASRNQVNPSHSHSLGNRDRSPSPLRNRNLYRNLEARSRNRVSLPPRELRRSLDSLQASSLLRDGSRRQGGSRQQGFLGRDRTLAPPPPRNSSTRVEPVDHRRQDEVVLR
jgi:hypothetical protein